MMVIFILFLLIFNTSYAVDRSNFKTCEQSGFCRRCRNTSPDISKFVVLQDTLNITESSIHGSLFNIESNVSYTFLIEGLIDNTFRLRINEEKGAHARFQPVQSLVAEPRRDNVTVLEQRDNYLGVKLSGNNYYLFLQFSPFKVNVYIGKDLVVSVNDLGRFVFEHQRRKPAPQNPDEKGEEKQNVEDLGEWEERFKEHTDSKPYGPMAVAMDFSFPLARAVYGIPLHADNLSLRSTKNGNPYRLYNLDVFEYELYETMALYGSVPFLMAHNVNTTVGVFWLNAAETWVDIDKKEVAEDPSTIAESIVNFVSGGKKKTHTSIDAYFMSETGIVDVFIMLGPEFYDVTRQYSRLTGTAPLPQYFAIGYHQCRWNYNDQDDVNSVSENFDVHDIPMDVMWLDIEYTDGKKYFTWDSMKFSTPMEMAKNLTAKGRRLVVIIDPHIKRENNYVFHSDLESNDYYVKTKDGKIYDGWCWPGSSSYIDFFNSAAGRFYGSQYLLDNFKGTTVDVHIWNDMNEPSVFSGPEVTMPKDCVHYGGWEHRDVHNLYGFMHVMYTYEGLYNRSAGSERPFILTRSHFAGTQRYAAIWTGDNIADWEHLKISIPMCLSSAIGGISFCGADVGGFFKNPDPELFVRWYQTGAYLPFFRSHAHLETSRREPWLFDQQITSLIRAAIRNRYTWLPYWYTVFFEHERTGAPVIRPLFAEFPAEDLYEVDNEYLVGDAMLVRPVTEPGVKEVNVYFPGQGEVWYDKDTYQQIFGPSVRSIPTPLSKIPVYLRGGAIVPAKYRIRRSASLMIHDPFTLIVALDLNGTASGQVYYDDGKSFAYRQNEHTLLHLAFVNNQLTSKIVGTGHYSSEIWLERVVIVGIPNMFRKAILKPQIGTEADLDVLYNVDERSLTVRKPSVRMDIEWTISLH